MDTIMFHLIPPLSQPSSQPDDLGFWFDLGPFSCLWTWWVFSGFFWTLGWSWLPSLGLIWTLAYWLVFLAPLQGGCCLRLPCDAQLLTCPLQGNLPLFLPGRTTGEGSQYSLNPTMCIILPNFLLLAAVTQSLNPSDCKWPWSCMSQYL